MPAILKQWFDVVLEYPFAYGSKGDKLKNKNFVPGFTVGAPESGYANIGRASFWCLRILQKLEQTDYTPK
jgi:putative NADPH-quinone reductase